MTDSPGSLPPDRVFARSARRRHTGAVVRAGSMGLILGVLDQLAAPPLDGIPLLGRDIPRMALSLGILLLFLRSQRTRYGVLSLGLLGAVLGIATALGYYGTHLAVLGLGWGPAGTQWTTGELGGWSYLELFCRQTILPMLLSIGTISFAAGLLWGGLLHARQTRSAHGSLPGAPAA